MGGGGKNFSETVPFSCTESVAVWTGKEEDEEGGVPVSVESDTRLEISRRMWLVEMKNLGQYARRFLTNGQVNVTDETEELSVRKDGRLVLERNRNIPDCYEINLDNDVYVDIFLKILEKTRLICQIIKFLLNEIGWK